MNIASIDIGTNTVLLLIAEVNPNVVSLNPLLNIHRMPRLGKGVKPGFPIPIGKVNELKVILKEYLQICNDYNVEKIIITATNVFRISSNSIEICQELEREMDLKINIVSGYEEAELSFLGATSAMPNKNEFLVIDIGGGSTEVISGSRSNIVFSKSFQIGAVSSTEWFFRDDPPEQSQMNELEQYLITYFDELKLTKTGNNTPIAIAGTPTTLACIKHKLQDFDDKVIELNNLTQSEILFIVSDLSRMTSKQIDDKWPKIMRGRSDIILAGSIILLTIMKLLNLDNVYTSSRGIRYGAIIKYMMDNF
jgi:exopolyphosphatase / guanosine-5'-triphosphate,3'-diphosphate pyrophosphatase